MMLACRLLSTLLLFLVQLDGAASATDFRYLYIGALVASQQAYASSGAAVIPAQTPDDAHFVAAQHDAARPEDTRNYHIVGQCLVPSPFGVFQSSQNLVCDATSPEGGRKRISTSTTGAASKPSESPPQIDSRIAVPRPVPPPVEHRPKPEAHDTIKQAEGDDIESDSPLDNVKFMSFEEWKRDNLAKSGQNPDNIRQSRPSAQARRPSRNGGFDSFGEEGEIDLNFSGFPRKEDENSRVEFSGSGSDKVGGAGPSDASAGNKNQIKKPEAGTTSKARFNYASDDCAATVMKTNPEARSSSAILIEHKDSYMLNECRAPNKFFIVELCDDILVDTIVLANLEFFSSIFRAFRVSVSDRYPARSDRWKEIGTFEARNAREIQAFAVENPLIWARYVKVELLSHYGNEFYCPLSLLRVHGTTMMEEFRYQESLAQGEEQDPEEELEGALSGPANVPSAVPPNPANPVPKSGSIAGVDPSNPQRVEDTNRGTGGHKDSTVPNKEDGPADEHADSQESVNTIATADDQDGNTSADPSDDNSNPQGVSSLVDEDWDAPMSPSGHGSETASHFPSDSVDASSSGHSSDSEQTEDNSTEQAKSNPGGEPKSVSSSAGMSFTSQQAPRVPTSATTAPAPGPTTQESFFKSLHKRLLQLETNSSLSLQYIEAQSQMLREAFAQVERRQVARAEKFLYKVNSTVITDLRALRHQYDALWDTAIGQLNYYREEHSQDMLALSTRLSLMADELVFQKQLAVVQTTLVLTCLGLVIFVRAGGLSAVTGGSGTWSSRHRPATFWASLRNGPPLDRFAGGTLSQSASPPPMYPITPSRSSERCQSPAAATPHHHRHHHHTPTIHHLGDDEDEYTSQTEHDPLTMPSSPQPEPRQHVHVLSPLEAALLPEGGETAARQPGAHDFGVPPQLPPPHPSQPGDAAFEDICPPESAPAEYEQPGVTAGLPRPCVDRPVGNFDVSDSRFVDNYDFLESDSATAAAAAAAVNAPFAASAAGHVLPATAAEGGIPDKSGEIGTGRLYSRVEIESPTAGLGLYQQRDDAVSVPVRTEPGDSTEAGGPPSQS